MWAATNHCQVRHRLAVAPVTFRAISRPLLRPISLPRVQHDRGRREREHAAYRLGVWQRCMRSR